MFGWLHPITVQAFMFRLTYPVVTFILKLRQLDASIPSLIPRDLVCRCEHMYSTRSRVAAMIRPLLTHPASLRNFN